MHIEPGKSILSLAETVRKEHGVRIKFGRTNSRDCLHLTHSEQTGSWTIYEGWEWDAHPWNSYSRKEKRANREVQEAVANVDAQ